jgi:hypothetical protein
VRGVSNDILADLALALQTLFMTSSFRCFVCLCAVCVGCFALGHWSGACWAVSLFCFLGCFRSVSVVVDNVLFFVIDHCIFGLFSLFGIADARLSLPDLPANAWQLHDSCILGLLGLARAALYLHSASAKVSSG